MSSDIKGRRVQLYWHQFQNIKSLTLCSKHQAEWKRLSLGALRRTKKAWSFRHVLFPRITTKGKSQEATTTTRRFVVQANIEWELIIKGILVCILDKSVVCRGSQANVPYFDSDCHSEILIVRLRQALRIRDWLSWSGLLYTVSYLHTCIFSTHLNYV